MFKILQYPNPRLRIIAERIRKFDTSLQKLIDEIFETHYATSNCAALAATQLDVQNQSILQLSTFPLIKINLYVL